MRIALASFVALAAPGVASAAACLPGLPPTFTSAEVRRGEAAYAVSCALCHGPSLEGGVAPPLKGAAFKARWADKSLDDFEAYVTGLMPTTAPGSLSPKDYAAVTSHLLAVNGASAGALPLPASSQGCLFGGVKNFPAR